MQYSRSLFWLIAIVALTIGSCSQAPQYPIEPVITYEGINKGRIAQYTNGPVDSLQIQFSFTDGDGDLSLIDSDSVDIFLRDSRLPQIPSFFRFPLIDREGTGNGISGTATVTIINTNNICCIFENRLCAEDPDYPTDTFTYSIQIRDRAGNFSNIIQTELIEIACLPE